MSKEGAYPNALIGAALITNCPILERFETREFHSERAIFVVKLSY